jgi:hypothetical protein
MIFGEQCRELTKLSGRSGLLLDGVIASTIREHTIVKH